GSRRSRRRWKATKTPFGSCCGFSSTTRTATGARRSRSAWRRIRGGRGCWSPTTDLAFRPSIASAFSSGSTGPMPHVQVRTPASDFPSRAGSSPSITAGSLPARRPSGARRFSSTSRSYAVLNRGRHARGMFDIAPDHAIGLYVGLLALPLALIAIQLRRPRDVSGTVLGASVLMAISGGIGLVLVPVAGERPWRRRRWGTLAVAVPLLTVVTISVAWIDALARPDTQHVHVGAVLQQTNDVATPEQEAAAKQLYDQTVVAIAP